ncbi:MAG: signal peptidase II [Candidatus Baltobacteraceae bacterium]
MSRNRNFNSAGVILTVALIACIADQWSKQLVITRLCNGDKLLHFCRHPELIPGLVNIWGTQNHHGAFGLFGSNGPLLLVLAVAVLVVFWFAFRDHAANSRLVSVAFGMIVGGAIGNMIDRVHFGYVVDFINFYGIWPNIFNIGDSCITVGVALLLISSFVSPRRHA